MRVLMVSRALDWLEPPRLLRSLACAGAHVAYLAHKDSMLTRTRHADHRFEWDTDQSRHGQNLEYAVAASGADRLLPADEAAAQWLHARHRDPHADPALRALIARSLGDPDYFQICGDKLAITKLAAELDIDIPTTEALDHDVEAGLFVHRNGWPVVIKSRRGFAGIGVYPCASLSDLRHAQRNCPRNGGRLIQQFCPGTTWMNVFAADGGETLAQLCFAKERQHPEPIGPSTVVRADYDREMQDASARLVRALGFSGFGSIDYLRTEDGRSLLLEFNPRPTPVCHLGKLLGVDLASAWVDGTQRDSQAVDRGTRIALFPQELRRDRTGAGLAGCLHDVPQDEPELLAAMRGLLSPEASNLIRQAH